MLYSAFLRSEYCLILAWKFHRRLNIPILTGYDRVSVCKAHQPRLWRPSDGLQVCQWGATARRRLAHPYSYIHISL